MVAELKQRGISDARVLRAMAEIPRQEFVPAELAGDAYRDGPLPIGNGQTISQPWIVAIICECLQLTGTEHVLEVGTGSGYSAALLSRLASSVVTVERDEQLLATARATLSRLSVDGVESRLGDGSLGCPGRGPFDAIAVHARAPAVPESLTDQLAVGGRLVLPVQIDTPAAGARLVRVLRTAGGLQQRDLGECSFVPLVGKAGYDDG